MSRTKVQYDADELIDFLLKATATLEGPKQKLQEINDHENSYKVEYVQEKLREFFLRIQSFKDQDNT